ncbi:hypothetical protein N7512_005698 [Penicillium capsulatum]|nr:hypothetical protein N7512_005698 [Penicillium capsulatum]
MTTIADLIAASAALHDLSDNELDHRLHEHVAILRKLITTKALDQIAQDETLFDYFDPSRDSVTYLLLLRLRLQILRETTGRAVPVDLLPGGRLWLRAAYFLDAFDRAQVCFAGQEFRYLIELVAEASQTPILSVLLIRNALLRLDPSCAMLTSIHLLLIRLCLHAKAYTCALPVLDQNISHLPIPNKRPTPKSTSKDGTGNGSNSPLVSEIPGISANISSMDYLRYFLYGGMVYMALKEWRKASHFLGIVISMPTAGSISMIMIEAYKKWVLVGLLQKGQLPPPPKITSSQVVKAYQSLAKPYVSLAQAFESGDVKRFDAEVDAARETWSNDNNMGLVSQLQRAFTTHAVMRIKSTFSALTLAELAQQAPSLPQNENATESAVASLIMSGAIHATLVHPPRHTGPTMLRFPTTSGSSSLSRELSMQTQFRGEKQTLEKLMNSLRQSNHSLGLSDEVVDSMQKNQEWAAAGDTGSGMGEQPTAEMEEDIMGELS